MSPFLIGGCAFAGLFGCVAVGIPIAFAAAFVGTIGLLIISGPAVTWMYVGGLPYSEVAFYGYTIIPLFILMGDFAFEAGFAEGVYFTARKWFGRLPGGLAIATAIGGAGFGAACGSSVAASAVLAKVCIPEMRKYNYSPSLSAGTVAACANLSSIMPPSGLMIVFAILTDQSVGKLLIAGVIPALVIAVLFSSMIGIRCAVNHALGPAMTDRVSWGERFLSLGRSWNMIVTAAIIVVGIYLGIYSPTEAAAAGAFWTFVSSVLSKRLSLQSLKHILVSTSKTTSMLLLIIAGVMIFTRFLVASRMPYELSLFLSRLPVPPTIILLCMISFYVILGMFFDAVSMLVITLTTFFPTVVALGYDPIWFGVICVLMCEIGLITPPVGMNCYVVAATAPDISLEKVFRGVIPFLLPSFGIVLLLVLFPQIALFLVERMRF